MGENIPECPVGEGSSLKWILSENGIWTLTCSELPATDGIPFFIYIVTAAVVLLSQLLICICVYKKVV
jgi:hypothetical protein